MRFDKTIIDTVWDKAQIVDGFDPARYRKDACGAWIIREKYGHEDSLFGWEIDHICPQSLLEKKGFSQEQIDHIDNLRAMQHQNNASKGDDYPSYVSVIAADENKNKRIEQSLTVNSEVRALLSQLYFDESHA